MQKIVYTGKFVCELCNKEIVLPVYGDLGVTFTPEEELECIDWIRHYHWIDFHRICAICGKIVRTGELELAVNDGRIKINKNYTDEYRKAEQGDEFGHLLIVHEDCIKNKLNLDETV